MKEEQKFGVVDRIEGDFAVIIVGREPQTVSCADLPSDIKEGDSVDLLTYKINKTENKRRGSRVKELLQKIFK